MDTGQFQRTEGTCLQEPGSLGTTAPSLSEDSAELYLDALEPMDEKEEGVPTFRQIMDGTLYMLKELDSESLAEAFSSSLMLEGEAKEYVKEEYGKLDKILEENRQNGTAASFFVPGSRNFFELFSRWIPLFCTLEGILAGVLLMMRSVSETFSTGTANVVYATKAGGRSRIAKGELPRLWGYCLQVASGA